MCWCDSVLVLVVSESDGNKRQCLLCSMYTARDGTTLGAKQSAGL